MTSEPQPTQQTPDAHRSRHSRLTAERELEIYEHALELLCEVGYEALTMDAVAARSHASKATLYRQWRGKAQLIVTALRATKRGPAADIDTGSLRGDLHTLIGCSDTDGSEDTVRNAALVRALGIAVQQHPELFEALREQLIDPEVSTLHGMVRRAVDRGEVSADSPALPFVVHMLLGYALAQPFLEEGLPEADDVLPYIDAVVLPALGAAP